MDLMRAFASIVMWFVGQMVSNIVQEALVELLAGFLVCFCEMLVSWPSQTLIDNGDYIGAEV